MTGDSVNGGLTIAGAHRLVFPKSSCGCVLALSLAVVRFASRGVTVVRDCAVMEEQRSGEQVPSAEPSPEAQRNWVSFIEGAVAATVVNGVVSDAYGAVKGAAKKALDKVSGDRAPDAGWQDPGPTDPSAGDGSS